MKKFIVLYYAPPGAWESSSKDPEDMKKGQEAWMDWAKKCGEGLLDMGSPLGNGMKVTKNSITKSEKEVLGYSVLQANDMESAMKMLSAHPHLAWGEGCEIEVYESMPM